MKTAIQFPKTLVEFFKPSVREQKCHEIKNSDTSAWQKREALPQPSHSRVTLQFDDKLYRAYYSVMEKTLTVSCGGVTATDPAGSYPEQQAREMLHTLAQSGLLEQFGEPIETLDQQTILHFCSS